MKMFLMSLVMLMGFAAHAQDMGVVFGIRNDNADAKTSGVTVEGKNSFNAGLVAKFELSSPWQVRSGFIYTQRAFDVKVPASTTGYKFTYFEIPAGVLYKFNEFGGVFAGPNLAFNLSKDCGSNTCEGVNSAPIGFQLGGSFKFAPQMGFEVYYETLLSKVADEVTNARAVVANFMITFD